MEMTEHERTADRSAIGVPTGSRALGPGDFPRVFPYAGNEVGMSVGEKLLTAVLFPDDGVQRLTPMLVGEPGTGKTATIKSLFQERGYTVVTLIGSQMDRTDLAGIPVKSEAVVEHSDGSVERLPVTDFAVPKWQHIVMTTRKAVVFFDEYNTAPPDVRSSGLTLLAERRFPNGDLMPVEARLVGAMNPPDSGSEYFEMAPAVSNRLCFIEWRVPLNRWLNGFLTNWGQTITTYAEHKWRQRIAGFLSASGNGQWANRLNDPQATGAAYGALTEAGRVVHESAWASYRAWTNLAGVLASCGGDTEVEDAAMTGIVGRAAALAFRAHLDKMVDFDVEEVLADPASFEGWEELGPQEYDALLRGILSSVEDEDRDGTTAIENAYMILAITAGDEGFGPDGRRVSSPRLSLIQGQLVPILTACSKRRGKLPREKVSGLEARGREFLTLPGIAAAINAGRRGSRTAGER